MIHFVGAGSGAPDLITIRGKQLIETADILIYAGSLVNPELLLYAGPDCKIYNSAEMTLEIHVFTGLSENRWTFWMKKVSHMITVRVSVPSAEQHLL